LAAGGLTLSLAAATATTAPAQEGRITDVSATPADAPQRGPATPPEDADVKIRVTNASGGTVQVNEKVHAYAKIRPFVPDEVMQVRFSGPRGLVKRKNLRVKRVGQRNLGKVDLRSPKLLKPGTYRATAVHRGSPAQERGMAKSRKFHPKYPDLDPGNNNSKVGLFKNLLDKRGYFVGGGDKYDDGTSRAVMAFRKVNGMQRTFNATPEIFRNLADGKGGFNVQRDGAGRHVEVDISRQVMVLAEGSRARYIFHVSTGAPSTPSDRGAFRFYRKDPGYNSVGMYYSVYYNGGEATHGYKSVPPYNASHGCIRNPIPNSVFIYNWINLGMPIYVYS
jgi:L,D-transpeptidase catalytic domain